MAAAPSATASDPATLSWQAPPACPDETYVAQEIKRFLGASPTTSADKPVRASAVVSRVAGDNRWRVEVSTESKDGTQSKTLEDASCRSVASATAFFIALVVNPERVAATQEEPEVQPKPPQKLVPESAPEVLPHPDEPAVAENNPWALRYTLGLSAMVDLRTLPSTGYGAGLAMGILTGPLGLELTGSYLPKRDVALSPDPGVGAAFRKWNVGLRGCGSAKVGGPVEIGGCAGGEYTILNGDSFGVANPKSDDVRWIELVFGPTVRALLGRYVAIRLDGSLGVPLQRQNIAIAPYGVVHTLPSVTGRVGLGVEMRY